MRGAVVPVVEIACSRHGVLACAHLRTFFLAFLLSLACFLAFSCLLTADAAVQVSEWK